MQYIGKIDRKKLGRYANKIVTEDVILTEERIEHIKQHHPGDYENYRLYITDILTNPDYIINDNKNIDTVLYLKTILQSKKNIQVVLKLNTNKGKIDKQNSILTLWKIKEKSYTQLIRNRKIIYKKVDKNE